MTVWQKHLQELRDGTEPTQNKYNSGGSGGKRQKVPSTR